MAERREEAERRQREEEEARKARMEEDRRYASEYSNFNNYPYLDAKKKRKRSVNKWSANLLHP